MLFAHSRDVINSKAVQFDVEKTVVVTCSANMVNQPALPRC